MPQTCSTWVPGAFALLSAKGLPEVVLLCAPASETEWYCVCDKGAFTIDCLVFVDMVCELVSLTPEMVERGQRFQDKARMHSEDFSSVAAAAAVRAELVRARHKSCRACKANLLDYFEPTPFEWPTATGWESRATVSIL